MFNLRKFLTTLVMSAVLLCGLAASAALVFAADAVANRAVELETVPARALGGAMSSQVDGLVEAVRSSVVSAQVSGAIIRLNVKVGDRVAAGQVLVQLDARTAEQTAVASEAQIEAARATLMVASRELARQKLLFEKRFISQAALDRAESEFYASKAQVDVQIAQSGAARATTGLFVVRAPFAGIVSEVPVALGDMALPGKPLVTVYDPVALRVTAAVPQSLVGNTSSPAQVRLELPGMGATAATPTAAAMITPARLSWLPTFDAATHSLQLRADLPAGLAGVLPGMFARVWLTAGGPLAIRAEVSVPARAIVRRAEVTALYVLDANRRPVLRQVRLGRAAGDQVEVLSGVTAGEQIVLDAQAAARVR